MNTSDREAEGLMIKALVEILDGGKPSKNLYFPFVHWPNGNTKPRACIVIVGDPPMADVRAVIKALHGSFETITINIVDHQDRAIIQDAYERGGNGGAFERSWDHGIATVRCG